MGIRNKAAWELLRILLWSVFGCKNVENAWMVSLKAPYYT